MTDWRMKMKNCLPLLSFFSRAYMISILLLDSRLNNENTKLIMQIMHWGALTSDDKRQYLIFKFLEPISRYCIFSSEKQDFTRDTVFWQWQFWYITSLYRFDLWSEVVGGLFEIASSYILKRQYLEILSFVIRRQCWGAGVLGCCKKVTPIQKHRIGIGTDYKIISIRILGYR